MDKTNYNKLTKEEEYILFYTKGRSIHLQENINNHYEEGTYFMQQCNALFIFPKTNLSPVVAGLALMTKLKEQ